MANQYRTERLAVCRTLLLVESVLGTAAEVANGVKPTVVVEPRRERCCEACGSRRLARLPLTDATANTS